MSGPVQTGKRVGTWDWDDVRIGWQAEREPQVQPRTPIHDIIDGPDRAWPSADKTPSNKLGKSGG